MVVKINKWHKWLFTDEEEEDEDEEEDNENDNKKWSERNNSVTARLSAEQVKSVFPSNDEEFDDSDISLTDFDIEVSKFFMFYVWVMFIKKKKKKNKR